MSKFGALIYFKKTKARVDHICSSCGKKIRCNDFYYVETMQDNPLYRLRAKELCLACYRNLEKN
jgi:hypothetical protein